MSDSWNKQYHWRTKGTTAWAKSYFNAHLVGLEAQLAGGSVKTTEIKDWEGDVELGNRKNKLITIYDCSFALAWSGQASDGSEAAGVIRWPEVSHEIEDNDEEYRFETELTTGGNSVSSLYSELRSKFAPTLIPVFKSFRPTLVATHAGDLGHEQEAENAKKNAKPIPDGAPVIGAAEEKKASDESAEREKKEKEDKEKAGIPLLPPGFGSI
ncbi:Uncharacterized conserved protein [Ceraceosorus bombacis]|uniref:Uncharacterized conserved protein n=1 Tax=Ceraceosorus bombacis TaxID=401625 RepID=A0A0P1BC60_9BASI|nr:Uncharacterized conserved protein [Ceraceosorus bombacis]